MWSCDRKITITVVTCVSTRKQFLWSELILQVRDKLAFPGMDSLRAPGEKSEPSRLWVILKPMTFCPSSWPKQKEEIVWWKLMLTEKKEPSYHINCCNMPVINIWSWGNTHNCEKVKPVSLTKTLVKRSERSCSNPNFVIGWLKFF